MLKALILNCSDKRGGIDKNYANFNLKSVLCGLATRNCFGKENSIKVSPIAHSHFNNKLKMVFWKICSFLLAFNSVAFASLDPTPSFDKEAISLFGRRFLIVPGFQQPLLQVEQPQQQE